MNAYRAKFQHGHSFLFVSIFLGILAQNTSRQQQLAALVCSMTLLCDYEASGWDCSTCTPQSSRTSALALDKGWAVGDLIIPDPA